MSIETTVRLATMADASVLTQMAIDFRNHNLKTEPSDDAFANGVSALLQSRDACFLIAHNGGKACGYTLLRFRFSMWANGIDATLEDLYVDEAFRQKGIGEKLVSAAISEFRKRGVVTAHLDTNENNPASNKIYQRLGFSCISKRWNGKQLFYRINL